MLCTIGSWDSTQLDLAGIASPLADGQTAWWTRDVAGRGDGPSGGRQYLN